MRIYKYIICILFFKTLISQNIIISDIDVVGLNRLNKEDIYRISKLYPGYKIVRGDEINKAINRLWDIGRFSNIQVYADNQSESNLSLKIELQELPVLGKIEFIGNRKKKDRTLIDIMPKSLAVGQILSESKIFDAKNNIISKYK